MVKILIVTNYFVPEGGSGARLAADLAGWLAARGDEVQVLAPRPSYHVMEDAIPVAGVKVVRYGLAVPCGLPHRLTRAWQHLVQPWSFMVRREKLAVPDLIYSFHPPLATTQMAGLLARVMRRPHIVHVQDLFPHNALDTGMLKPGRLSWMLERASARALKGADRAIVHAPSAIPLLETMGVRKAVHIPNWVDVERFQGADPAQVRTRFAALHRNRVLVLYAGILGVAQGVEQVIRVAQELKERTFIHFVIAGDGPYKGWLMDEVRRLGLPNITILPMVGPDDYPLLVQSCSIFMVTLAPGVSYPVIPSRIADAVAAGKPIVGMLPPGDARDLVVEQRLGRVADPGDVPGAARHVLKLAQAPEKRARHSRRALALAPELFGKEQNLSRIAQVIDDEFMG